MKQERCYTVGVPNNVGPLAIQQRLNLSSERGHRHLEAWIGNFGSSNVYIFSGNLSTTQCAQLLEQGFIDCLMALSYSGPTRVQVPEDISYVTVYFEAVNSSGQTETVTLKVMREHHE